MARGRKNFEEVAIMHTAYWVLKTKGKTAFRLYVDDQGLSDVDIERVESKYRYETDPEFRQKVHDKLKAIQDKMTGSESDLTIEDEIPF